MKCYFCKKRIWFWQQKSIHYPYPRAHAYCHFRDARDYALSLDGRQFASAAKEVMELAKLYRIKL